MLPTWDNDLLILGSVVLAALTYRFIRIPSVAADSSPRDAGPASSWDSASLQPPLPSPP